ncbi:MAG: 8-amino-7-oxononanoate synthase [Verrucomicrobia bacterium]|nr:8-amino-7-oxononanoate synthase [Verrucomicrobiota bacterium]
MNAFDHELNQRLASIRHQGLLRELRRVDSPQAPRVDIGGRTLLNFSSNDYLGLANEPALKEAAIKAVERYGAGAGASRLICGSLAPHQELDEALAAFKGTEAALSFSTGYAAAIGAICALLGKDDIIILDKLVHACIVDAARLCGAKLRVIDHNDLNDLEAKLRWAAHRVQSLKSKVQSREGRALVVTESVFSMDGDHAPLREMVELKEKYGAWLMVDEAHATGLYGANRRGLAEELGVSERIEVQMGTLGKALGAAGGYICGSRALVDYLINRARTFIFSTAPVPAAAAAATAGVQFVQSSAGEERRSHLWRNVSSLLSTINTQASTNRSAIIPIMIGEETKAVEAAAALREQGIFIPAIRYPTVARGQARLRLTLTATHSDPDLAQLQAALKSLDFRL